MCVSIAKTDIDTLITKGKPLIIGPAVTKPPIALAVIIRLNKANIFNILLSLIKTKLINKSATRGTIEFALKSTKYIAIVVIIRQLIKIRLARLRLDKNKSKATAKDKIKKVKPKNQPGKL
jgi:hypothetical protein